MAPTSAKSIIYIIFQNHLQKGDTFARKQHKYSSHISILNIF